VTLRESGAMLAWHIDDAVEPKGSVAVQAKDCVFDIVGRDAALFQFAGKGSPDAFLPMLRLTGENTLANPNVSDAVWQREAGEPAAALDTSTMTIEGLLAIPFSFEGPCSIRPSESRVKSYQAPRKSGTPPGIDPKKLPDS
jgi:hypothetical protein